MPNFTKRAIMQSFMKLLNDQPLSKISVRAIVEDCGVNRNSFYYHFRDIPSLLEEIVEEAESTLLQKYPDIRSVEECFRAAFHFVLDNKRAVLHIYHSVNREMFEEYLMRNCERVVTKYLDNSFGAEFENTKSREAVVRLIKCELFGICMEWMNAGLPDSAIESLQALLTLCHGLAEELLQRGREIL